MESISYRPYDASSNEPIGARGWFAYITGLNLAFSACYLSLKPPEAHSSASVKRLIVSIASVGMACLVGWLGTRIVLSYRSKRHLPYLTQTGFRGWVFLPSIALFLQHESLWAQVVAILSATLMADYASRFMEAQGSTEASFSWAQSISERAMFSTDALITPRSPLPFYVSVCLFGTFAAAVAGWSLVEVLLLSASIFLVVVQVYSMQTQALWNKSQLRSHVYGLAIVAVYLTFLALSPFINSFGVPFTGWSRPHLAIGLGQQKAPLTIFHAIILWPKIKDEKMTPPLRTQAVTTALGRSKIWSIPFNGPYWYTKIVGQIPGIDARATEGDPLKVNVRSADHSPLVMQAHQHLAEPIDLNCCRELQVVLRNDASFGATTVGLTLGDSRTQQVERLGTKNVPSENNNPSVAQTNPLEVTLSFSIPQHGTIKSFDDITVELQAEEKRWTLGRKVAIERFIFIPR